MMKWITAMCSLIIVQQGQAQQIQGTFTVDTRAGFSTNTLLNPFFGEWDRSEQTAYGFVSPAGILTYHQGNLSADVTGGGVFESFMSDRNSLYGGFGLMNLRYRLGNSVYAGIESGGSRVWTSFDRSSYWAQPVISWSPTVFTRINAKVGSSFRSYKNILSEEGEETTERTRFDLYGLELETWPDFRWQVRGGLYGDLSAPVDNLSLMGSVEHQVSGRLRLMARMGIDQYSFQFTTQNGTGGGGFPPVGGPGGGNDVTVVDTDRIYRIGFSANYQLHRNITLLAGADQLNLNPSVSGESIQDFQVSAGLRFTIRPTLRRGTRAEPTWRINDNQVVTLRINYTGEGQLFMLGDFNDWEHPGIPLTMQSTRRYVAQLSLNPGAYEYKILLIEGEEEKWIDFTDETLTVGDGFGGENGLIYIE